MQLEGVSNMFLKIRWKETDKCQLLMSKDESSEIHIGEFVIKSSKYEKLLGIKIDSKLPFWWWRAISM